LSQTDDLENIDVIPELAGKANGGSDETGTPVDIPEPSQTIIGYEFIDAYGPTHTFDEPAFKKIRRGLVKSDEAYFEKVKPALHTMTPSDREVLEDDIAAVPRKSSKTADGARKPTSQFGDFLNEPTDEYSDLFPTTLEDPEGQSASEAGDEDPEQSDTPKKKADEINDSKASAALEEVKGDLDVLGDLKSLKGIFKKERRGLVLENDESTISVGNRVNLEHAFLDSSQDHDQAPRRPTADFGDHFEVDEALLPIAIPPIPQPTQEGIEDRQEAVEAQALAGQLAPFEDFGLFKKKRRGFVLGHGANDVEANPSLHTAQEKYADILDADAVNDRLSEHTDTILFPNPRPFLEPAFQTAAEKSNEFAGQPQDGIAEAFEKGSDTGLVDLKKERRALVFGLDEDLKDVKDEKIAPEIDHANIHRRPLVQSEVETIAEEEMEDNPSAFVLPPQDDYLIAVEQQVAEETQETQEESGILGAFGGILKREKRGFVFGHGGFKLPVDTQSPPETDAQSRRHKLPAESLDERLEDPDQSSQMDNFDPNLPAEPRFQSDMEGVDGGDDDTEGLGPQDDVDSPGDNTGESRYPPAAPRFRNDPENLGPQDTVDSPTDNTGESQDPPVEPQFRQNLESVGDANESLDKSLQNSTQTLREPYFKNTTEAVASATEILDQNIETAVMLEATQVVDNLGPTNSNLPVPTIKRRRLIDEDRFYNYPEARQSKLDESETQQLRGELTAGENKLTKGDKDELDRPDQTNFDEFLNGHMPDRTKIQPKKEDDFDEDEPVQGFPIKKFSNKMKKAISVIPENKVTTGEPVPTIRREIHHETQVVSRNVHKEIYIVNGTPVPTPPRLRRPPFDVDDYNEDEDDGSDGRIPRAWLRDSAGVIGKREENEDAAQNVEKLNIPLLNGGIGAGLGLDLGLGLGLGTPQGRVVDAYLGAAATATVGLGGPQGRILDAGLDTAATATLGLGSSHGLPLEAAANGLIDDAASLLRTPENQGTPTTEEETPSRRVGSIGSVVNDPSLDPATHGLPIGFESDGLVDGAEPNQNAQQPNSASRIAGGAGLGGAALLEGNNNNQGFGLGAAGVFGGAASLEDNSNNQGSQIIGGGLVGSAASLEG
ncbi:hypothetical protein HYALB_00011114, partial [Hymenoscyphus albidus]